MDILKCVDNILFKEAYNPRLYSFGMRITFPLQRRVTRLNVLTGEIEEKANELRLRFFVTILGHNLVE